MSVVDVRVIRVGQPAGFPEINPRKVVEGEISKAAILEKGTDGGKASIALIVTLNDGRTGIIQTTAAIFEMISAVARGACASWGEELGDNMKRQ